jgi:hypothetical protein
MSILALFIEIPSITMSMARLFTERRCLLPAITSDADIGKS